MNKPQHRWGLFLFKRVVISLLRLSLVLQISYVLYSFPFIRANKELTFIARIIIGRATYSLYSNLCIALDSSYPLTVSQIG